MNLVGRDFVVRLWRIYEPYADTNFKTELATDFASRFWEMYLTCLLLEQGFDLYKRNERPKAGPDIGIKFEGRTIWIEAVAPSAGNHSSADRVPEIPRKKAASLPADQIILRYRTAIEEKRNKLLIYKQQNIVKPDDPYVIAINSRKLPFWRNGNPPLIVKAVYPIGNEYLTLDRKTGDVIGQGTHRRDFVEKANNAQVATDVFLDPNYASVSGLFFSRVDAWNTPSKPGGDMIYVHNFSADPIIEITHSFFKFGQEFWISEDEGGEHYVLQQHSWV